MTCVVSGLKALFPFSLGAWPLKLHGLSPEGEKQCSFSVNEHVWGERGGTPFGTRGN